MFNHLLESWILTCTKGLNSSNTELIFNISALGGLPCNLVVDCMNKIVPKVPESDYYETLYFDFSNLVKMQTKCLLLCCFFFFFSLILDFYGENKTKSRFSLCVMSMFLLDLQAIMDMPNI